MRKWDLRGVTALSTALLVAATGQAQARAAEDAKAEAAVDGGDIVVTARRQEERLQDVPISITVLDQASLNQRNVSDGMDLVGHVPSLSANTRFGVENATFAIRGFFQETGTSPSVGVYFADVVAPRGFGVNVPAGDGAGPGTMFDLQNVQILKGPQGTLFGRNTTGGAILLVPRKPVDRIEGYVEGTVGNYDARRVQAVLNAPLSSTIRLRVGLDHQKRDGYLINDSGIGPRDFNDVNYLALRASLVVDVTPDLENYTVASDAKSHNNGTVQKISACYAPVAAFFGTQPCDIAAAQDARGFFHTVSDLPNPSSRLKTWQVVNTTAWRASDNLTVKNIFSYARLKNRLDTPLYGTRFFFPTGPAFLGDVPVSFINLRSAPGANLANQSTLTEELQLQGSALDGALTWQGGLYYENSRPEGQSKTVAAIIVSCTDPATAACFDITSTFPPFFQPFGSVVSNDQSTRFQSKAAYAQATYALNDQIKLTGGIRYTWDRMSQVGIFRSLRFPVLFGPPVDSCTFVGVSYPACRVDLEKKSSAPTWLLGIDYKPVEDVLLYAKYSRGYRTGGVQASVPGQYATFEPEKLDSFEIGMKSSYSGAISGFFNVSAFYNKLSDQQIQYGFKQNTDRRDSNGAPLPTIGVTPTAGPVNAGKSRIWGIEVDAQVKPFEGLQLSAAYSYLNAQVQQIPAVVLPSDDPYKPDGQIVAGDRFPYSPEHSLLLAAQYTLPLADGVGEVTIGASYNYTAAQIASYSLHSPALLAYFGRDLGVLGSRNIVDAFVNWERVGGSLLDLGVFVTNLTNDQYYNSISGYAEDLGFVTSGVGQPRMYGLRARISFGSK